MLPDTVHELRNLDISSQEITVDGAFTTTATNNALEDLASTPCTSPAAKNPAPDAPAAG